MKKTFVTDDNRTFDIYFHREGAVLLDISIYEVKHPERKRFFRSGFFPFYSVCIFIDDYDSVKDCLIAALGEALEAEKIKKARDEKFLKMGLDK